MFLGKYVLTTTGMYVCMKLGPEGGGEGRRGGEQGLMWSDFKACARSGGVYVDNRMLAGLPGGVFVLVFAQPCLRAGLLQF